MHAKYEISISYGTKVMTKVDGFAMNNLMKLVTKSWHQLDDQGKVTVT